MNGYDLSRRWFDFAFENQGLVTAKHCALYMWIIEKNNRLGWAENFGFPIDQAGAAIGIKKIQTVREALYDLVAWGFVKLIYKSPNQYKSNIISIVNCSIKTNGVLDLALRSTENSLTNGLTNGLSIGSPIGSTLVNQEVYHGFSTVPIIKSLNKETIKPRNQETSADRDEIKEGFVPPQKEEVNPPPKVARKGSSKFDPLIVDLPFEGDDFKNVWSDWIIHRKQKRSSLTEKSVIEQLKLLSCYTETVAIKMILKSITSGWLGIFPIKETGNGNQLNQSNPVDGVSERLKGAWELLAEHHKNN